MQLLPCNGPALNDAQRTLNPIKSIIIFILGVIISSGELCRTVAFKEMVSLVTVDQSVVENLEKALVRDDTPLSSKYRILFSLRNIEGSKAHAAMLQGGSRESCGHAVVALKRTFHFVIMPHSLFSCMIMKV